MKRRRVEDGLPPLHGRSEGEDLYGPREVLNEVRFRPELDLDLVELRYVHRGGPGGHRWARGSDVLDVGASFVTLQVAGEATQVPLHRVDGILYDGELVWARDGGHEGAASTAGP